MTLEKLIIIIGIIITIITLITYIWFTIRYKNVLDSHISSPLIYMIYVLMSMPVFVCTFNITLLIMLLLYE